MSVDFEKQLRRQRHENLLLPMYGIVAGDVQNYVESMANVTEAEVLNYTASACAQVASRFHIPQLLCTAILPSIKGPQKNPY